MRPSVLLTLSLLLAAQAAQGCGPAGGGKSPSHPPIVVRVADGAAERIAPALQAFQDRHPSLLVTWPEDAEEANYNAAVTARPLFDFCREEVLSLPGLTVNTPSRQLTLKEGSRFWFSSSLDSEVMEELAAFLKVWMEEGSAEWTMHVGGDIIPGRRVAKAIVERGPLFPFDAVAPLMQGGDIVFADLEAPISDRYPPPFSGVEFIGPSSTIEGLKLLGLDLVNLANNHSTNFGTAAFTDTLRLLEANGIRYVGGGRDYQQAYSHVTQEAGGVEVAFLSYNCVLGSVNATPERPGVAWMDLPPYYQMNPAQVRGMQEKVMRMGDEADVVVACFHWNEEYVPPSSSTVALAHAACDAGADLVIGSHPHCIQPFEFYGESFIIYNLGNLVFDQMHRDITREGFIAHLHFRGDRLFRVDFIPYLINDPCRPVPVDGAAAVSLSEKLLRMSGY